jgi:hypothetical protein
VCGNAAKRTGLNVLFLPARMSPCRRHTYGIG